jgi:hypothetical protein
MRRMVVVFSYLAAALGCFATTGNAQRYEIHPYAGGFFPGKFAGVLEMANDGMYGIKGGIHVRGGLTAEGHFGFINHLDFAETETRKRAYVWEGMASYTFGLFGLPPKLYGSFGIGGVRTSVSADSRYFWGSSIPAPDRFLSLSYGGGIKSSRLWGPAGYRADVRARTLPHYYGFKMTWLEITGGPVFTWGGYQ